MAQKWLIYAQFQQIFKGAKSGYLLFTKGLKLQEPAFMPALV
jgi:hypothetical protein